MAVEVIRQFTHLLELEIRHVGDDGILQKVLTLKDISLESTHSPVKEERKYVKEDTPYDQLLEQMRKYNLDTLGFDAQEILEQVKYNVDNKISSPEPSKSRTKPKKSVSKVTPQKQVRNTFILHLLNHKPFKILNINS